MFEDSPTDTADQYSRYGWPIFDRLGHEESKHSLRSVKARAKLFVPVHSIIFLTTVLARFLLIVLTIKNIPFTASWRHMAGERTDLMPHEIVDLILALKE